LRGLHRRHRILQCRYARAVATCGTALGEEHFKTMRNFAKRIVLAYDADKAGQSAAASVYQWEKANEVDVYVAHLPKGSDPAELAQKDPRHFERRSLTPSLSCGFDSTGSSMTRTSPRQKVECVPPSAQ